MSYIHAEISKARAELDNYRDSFKRISNAAASLRYVKNSSLTRGRGFDAAFRTLEDVRAKLEENIQKCNDIANGLEQVISEYEKTEKELTEYIPSGTGSSGFFTPGYELAEGHPGITAWLGKAEATFKKGIAEASVSAVVGKVEAEGKAEFSFFKGKKSRELKDGKWEEKESAEYINAELSGGISAVAATVTAEGSLGNEYLKVKGKATVDVGKGELKGKGKFSVSEKGVDLYAEGSAIVSAVEAEASGTINILGLQIKAKGSAYAGAVGVEGKIGVNDGKFVIEGGAAALVGLSGGLEIGIDTEFWDNVSENVDKVKGAVSDAFDGFVDFISFW